MLKDWQGIARQFIGDNASTILTAGGVVGTVTTAVLAGRAGAKANELLKEQAEEYENPSPMDKRPENPSRMDKIVLVAPVFVPPVITGSLTISAIIMAHRVSASKAAALAAAYGMTQSRFDEYRAKVAEKLTGPKKQGIDDEVAQDHVTRKPPTNEVIILAGGDVLCYDMATGRYFRSTVEQIRRAEHVINNRLANCQYASLTEFYDEIGLPPTSFSDTVGWSALTQDMPFEVKLSTTMTPDEKPCIAIDFNILPTPDYARSY